MAFVYFSVLVFFFSLEARERLEGDDYYTGATERDGYGSASVGMGKKLIKHWVSWVQAFVIVSVTGYVAGVFDNPDLLIHTMIIMFIRLAYAFECVIDTNGKSLLTLSLITQLYTLTVTLHLWAEMVLERMP